MIDEFKDSIENFVKVCVEDEFNKQFKNRFEDLSKQEIEKIMEEFDDVINKKIAFEVKKHFELLTNLMKESLSDAKVN